ncbi:site-specific integrase [Pseudomonas sp. AOB-7]|uniref:tyrosine-type recombinase/integrase n=1 Tax=Pseudomonas sp. AOB-7 TaxID=2482750 RepID=UPI000EFD35C9|nr:site-specific integrase [Pseudomonas sp. AOB-7]RMH85181.1 site-specific integrase [Pseudomonas sp. AOB-7]
MATGELTARNVSTIIKAAVPGNTIAGPGLYLQISRPKKAGGAVVASWVFRYQLDGRRREMGLGSCSVVTLAEARLRAADQRKILAAGNDPLAARDAEREQRREAERQAQARRITFETLANEYQQAHGASWSDKWRRGWLRKLELYAFPIIGKMPAGEIRTEHVLKVLQPIWAAKTRTADEVRGQIEQVLDAAKAHRLRDGDNPARWRGHLDNLLSKAEKKKARQRQHFPAMHWRDVPALMVKLAQTEGHVAVAARLMILTGARAHMVRFAAWAEFDLDDGVWSLPAARMKMRKAFAVPLAAEVVGMLKAMPRQEGSPYLFPGQGKSGVMHANAIRTLLHGMGHDDITRHGFRSSFRDWASEATRYPREVCELALAHDERDQTEAAYSRSDFLEKRRNLMCDWARYCASTPGEVVRGEFGRRA